MGRGSGEVRLHGWGRKQTRKIMKLKLNRRVLGGQRGDCPDETRNWLFKEK